MLYTSGMDQDTTQRLDTLEQKIDAIYVSVEKTRQYFLWTLITSVVLFVLPLIGLAFAIPAFMTNYVDQIQNLGV